MAYRTHVVNKALLQDSARSGVYCLIVIRRYGLRRTLCMSLLTVSVVATCYIGPDTHAVMFTIVLAIDKCVGGALECL